MGMISVVVATKIFYWWVMSADVDGVPDAGAVYIYKIEDNGNYDLCIKISPDKVNEDNFGPGQSQNHLAVGAMSADIDGVSDAGAVYIYKLEDNGTTTYVFKISAAYKATDIL